MTLGRHRKHVLSQAQMCDAGHPTDREYVENVIWSSRTPCS
jgi:hypothetical protein